MKLWIYLIDINEKLDVICEDLWQNPQCSHGPTLLFVKKRVLNNNISLNNSVDENCTIEKEYYACSVYRSTDGCPFYMNKSEFCGVYPQPDILFNITELKLQRDLVTNYLYLHLIDFILKLSYFTDFFNKTSTEKLLSYLQCTI